MNASHILRSEYIEDASNLHHAYFSQFVTESTRRFVISHIGLKRLQASKDEHLNDVVKWEQGGRTWLWDRTPINSALAKELGEGRSMASRCCVGKACARMLLEENQSA